MAGAAKTIEATYDVPIIAHAPMEPLNAIAHVQADRVDVWVGTQNADVALTMAAQASGMAPEKVYIHNTFSGGGFGRRLGPDEVFQAAAVSKAVGKPVKLIWTREEDIAQGMFRPQSFQCVEAATDAGGKVTGWIDLQGLLTPRERASAEVLNGIAYDQAGDRLFVTGKLWPKLFEIRIVQKP